MQRSIRVPPTFKPVLDASSTFAGPKKENCLKQVAHVHNLRDSEASYDKHQFNLSMQMLRDHEGAGVPLRMCMDLFAAKQIGRLPFLQSSRLMEDVLLGKDEMIGFSDFLNTPENNEFMSQPHAVVEKSLGIL